MADGTQIATGTWNVAECPLQIEFSLRVLDDIRLAVVDAFYSLPRGGAEIGGILLGRHEGNRISITDFEALDCEHAMGPSFTLSQRDQAQLAEIIAAAKRRPGDWQSVGWYHSHTRSEIFLSETDQDIHNRFFPELWQIALVLRPHTFEPMRGGFFFREADGSMRGTASYQEFVLDPLPVKQMPSGDIAKPRPSRENSLFREPLITAPSPPPVPAEEAPAETLPIEPSPPQEKQVPITREILAASTVADRYEQQEDEPNPVEIQAPQFAQMKPERSWRTAKLVACLAAALAAAALGYQTRDSWLPEIQAKLSSVMPKEPVAPAPYLSLGVSDDNGQLKIHWDPNAPAVKSARSAALEISDGSAAPRSIPLDSTLLAAGSFSYGREAERVDVVLIASQPDGRKVREQAGFLGKLPAANRPVDDTAIRQERDALAQKADKLQKELDAETARNRKLEKDLNEIRDRFVEDQKKRMAIQSADPGKKD